MAMNIAVVSPHSNKVGTTTVASLIAFELSMRGRTVCMTHVTAKSPTLFGYFGINNIEDKTSNPHKIVKMLRESIIRPEDVRDYCKPINNNYDMFSVDRADFEKDDLLFALDYISTSFPHDFIVYDFDSGKLEGEIEETLIRRMDMAVIVISPDKYDLEKFKKQSKHMIAQLGKMPIMVVVNQFTGVSGSLKEVASWAGVKQPNRWYTVRYNAYLQWATNNGKMGYISERMRADDSRVIDIAKDAKSIGNGILKIKVAKRQASIKGQNSKKKEETGGAVGAEHKKLEGAEG